MTESDTQESTSADATQRPLRLLDYLRLFRLPNVFTAIADILMGFVVAGGFVETSGFAGRTGALVLLVLASALMYTAGMVLNDVYDVEVDLKERPGRPLPSGRINLGWATFLGYWMLLTGVAAAGLAGFLFPGSGTVVWRSGAVAVLLAVSVVAYDAVLKKTVLAPLAMGACRFFNVLLGMSVGATAILQPVWVLHFGWWQLAVAGGIGLYIVGVTWFARTEARISNRLHLAGAIALMAAGFGLLIAYPSFRSTEPSEKFWFWWPLLIGLLGLTLFRRAITAVMDPQPAKVQATIKQCIFSLIMLDAAVCVSVGEFVWGIVVLALLAPMFLLGRWVYST